MNGKGLFVVKPIRKDEVVVDFATGPGEYMTNEQLSKIYTPEFDFSLQVDDDLVFAARDKKDVEDSDYVNHSCDPNCGIQNKLQIVAMRKLNPGDEITFDYAMSESDPDFKMPCLCGADICRKVVTGNDWKIPKLQKKYNGYFSEYLQKKIDKLNQ